MDVVLLAARLGLAAVFVVASLAKVTDLAASQRAMRDFGVPEPLAQPAGVALPLVELAIAILLVPVATATGGAILALLLLLAFIGAIGANLARGNQPNCNCFGQLHSEPIGWTTLARNSGLAALALIVAVSGLAGDPGASLLGWTGALGAAGWLALIGLVAVSASTAGAIWLLVHLLGQNGRLLARLDQIEAALADADIELPDDDDADDEEADDESDEEGDPALGDRAPDFALTGLRGESITLDALRAAGKPTLLVFTSPTCGACEMLLPDVARWQREHAAVLTTVVIGRGTIADNKTKAERHGLTTVALQRNNETAEAYGVRAVPSGVLISTDGRLISGLAAGPDQIRQLAAIYARTAAPPPTAGSPNGSANGAPAAASSGQASALPIGTPAPAIELNALAGRKTRLNALGRQPTVLLFFDAGASLCQDIVFDLKGWEANPPAGAQRMVVIASGDVRAIRALGLRSRVLLDPTFQAVNAFGAVGTPSAVLLDAEGRVASPIAYSATSILMLANNQDLANPPVDGANRIGLVAPTFEGTSLDGATIRSADFAGRPTLLLFWDSVCGWCQRMLPDLKAWGANPPDGAPQLLIVARGDADALRAQALPAPVLHDTDRRATRAFRAFPTPSAVLIDADGRIGSPIATGAEQVFTLANGGAIPTIAPPRPAAPEPLRVGAPAPEATLSDLDDQEVALTSFRGAPTLLLFWRPGCGFCQRMLDDLKAWEANPPTGAPQLLIVSSEDVASNRAQGLRSPIVLDQDFSLGRAFGATGTPSAVLLDAEGRVASTVGVGAPAVLALATAPPQPVQG